MRPPSYVLDGTLPDLGTQAPVYRWTAHTVDVADGRTDSPHALGIDATATATADGFQASDNDATLTVTTSDGATDVSYYLGGHDRVRRIERFGAGRSAPDRRCRPGRPDRRAVPPDADTRGARTTVDVPPKLTAPVDVPSASDAETIARALLDHAGVLTGQQWATDVTDSGGIAISCAVGETCTGMPGEVTARDVTFTLMIGGARVSGIAWNVTVGEHSQIESVYGEWARGRRARHLRPALDRRRVHGAAERRARTSAASNPSSVDGDVRTPVAAATAHEPERPVTIEPDTVRPARSPVPGDRIGPTIRSPGRPIEVHVTGVSLGLARWDAVDGDQNVVDLVPVYVFHTDDSTRRDLHCRGARTRPGVDHTSRPRSVPTQAPYPSRVAGQSRARTGVRRRFRNRSRRLLRRIVGT